ncbi:hypothetical protein D3C75_1228460 [compost metagenome]
MNFGANEWALHANPPFLQNTHEKTGSPQILKKDRQLRVAKLFSQLMTWGAGLGNLKQRLPPHKNIADMYFRFPHTLHCKIFSKGTKGKLPA